MLSAITNDPVSPLLAPEATTIPLMYWVSSSFLSVKNLDIEIVSGCFTTNEYVCSACSPFNEATTLTLQFTGWSPIVITSFPFSTFTALAPSYTFQAYETVLYSSFSAFAGRVIGVSTTTSLGIKFSMSVIALLTLTSSVKTLAVISRALVSNGWI